MYIRNPAGADALPVDAGVDAEVGALVDGSAEAGAEEVAEVLTGVRVESTLNSACEVKLNEALIVLLAWLVSER